jgi:formamidopyrimidine-DNA glycosylase
LPELPDLEIIREVLSPALSGQKIIGIEVVRPLVVRDLTGRGFADSLVGRTIEGVERRGKLLILPLSPNLNLAINCKLAGRLQHAPPTTRRLAKTHVEFLLSSGSALRYSDRRTMGQIYLTQSLSAIPGWGEIGPEPFDLTIEEFRDRLRPYRGEIKGILTRGRVVAGIGNAYADEICFSAGVHPYRKRTSLGDEEIGRLYDAMQSVLHDAIETLRARVGSQIHREIRDFLAVHGRGGADCPACGNTISEITARGRLTNFCRRCQPGGLIRL